MELWRLVQHLGSHAHQGSVHVTGGPCSPALHPPSSLPHCAWGGSRPVLLCDLASSADFRSCGRTVVTCLVIELHGARWVLGWAGLAALAAPAGQKNDGIKS